MKGRKNKKLKWQVPGKNVMQGLSKVKDIWTKFQFILTGKQKRLAMVILFMTLIGAIVETLGVSIIIPFVQAMMEPELLMQNPYIKPAVETLHIEDSTQMKIGRASCRERV